MVNAAFIALGGANPGLLSLAAVDYGRTRSGGSYRRRMQEMDAEENRRRQEHEARRRRDARYVPADVRGLDPEEEGWLIDEIVAARSLEEQIAATELALKGARRDMKRSAYDLGLSVEEDGWLIDDIHDGVYVARCEDDLRDLRSRLWIEMQINNTEGRP